jgi:hypothetical protein
MLKGWLVDNHLTTDNKNDKYLLLESAGNLTQENLFNRMKEEDTGLRMETIEHVVKLHNRVVAKQVLNGFSVNTGLFRATPQFHGSIENGVWDPKKNSIHVNFIQDKDLREAIAETSVHILGEKGDAMYIIGGQDAATRAGDGTATAGRNYILHGRLIKLAGSDESVGISLTNTSTGQVSKITDDRLVVNNPTQVIILLPSDLPDGDYTLTLTTQYSNSGVLLKTPRSVEKTITIGQGAPSDPDMQPVDPPSGGYIDPNA